MPKARALSQKESLFVAEYLRDGNATRAAIAAGYSPRSADVLGSRLVRKSSVADAIARGRARLLDRAEVTAQDVIDRLTVIGMADIADVVEWDGKSVRIKPFDEID